MNNAASYAVEYSPNDDDDEDDDDEDDDGEDDEFGDGIDCSNPLVEHARSGRSTCIHCNTLIAFGALRFGVTQFTQEIYRHDRDMTRFLHVTCGRSYNHYRRSIGANTISLLNMHSLNNLSNSDRRIVESSI